MKNEIEESLKPLIGLPFWAAGRAADMEWFQFGGRIKVEKRTSGFKWVGEWALHVSCAWRICDPQKIVVASYDCYRRADHIPEFDEDFDWDVVGNNQRDQKMKSFMDGKEDSLLVTGICADPVGGFRLSLKNKFYLELFPDVSSGEFEYWRLFSPMAKSTHFVVTTLGIENFVD